MNKKSLSLVSRFKSRGGDEHKAAAKDSQE